MNTTANGLITARTQLKQQEKIARDIAVQRFERGIERRRQNKIAGSMLILLALIMANAWAAAQGWGL